MLERLPELGDRALAQRITVTSGNCASLGG
jgi:hypothetical protein